MQASATSVGRPAIAVSNLTKRYGEKTAVDGVSFTVSEGERFGLIGADGAGKTSIFRMLTTLLLPDGGSAMVNGSDIVTGYSHIRHTAGYMPGRFSLYQDLTVEENLKFFATVFGTTVEKNYDFIRDIYVQIEPFRTRRAGKLSGGMKQKLALCCALIHRPRVLFLDEPTTGVDPVSRKEFWEMLKRLKQDGITILVSTPYMDEAGLCDRIALIQDGKILTVDTPAAITGAFEGSLYKIKAADMYRLLNDLNAYERTKDCYAFGEYLHLSLCDDSAATRASIRAYLLAAGHTDAEWMQAEPTIEDCFIRYLKK
jgi:ABC-2 type transport system ATP-binding protein